MTAVNAGDNTITKTDGTVSFLYDPFGRRIYKSSTSGTSVYAYHGDNLVEETNSSGTVVARYAQGLNIDEPLAMLRSSTTSYYQGGWPGHKNLGRFWVPHSRFLKVGSWVSEIFTTLRFNLSTSPSSPRVNQLN